MCRNCITMGASCLVFLCPAGCSNSDYPEPETKRLVVRCVQEPAIDLQDYYSRPQAVNSVLDRAPIDQIIETAKRNRAQDLEQLSPPHRALVETRMVELARWLDTNTVVTATRPAGAPATGFNETFGEVRLPSAENLDAKAKSLCIEVFHEW
jgi:hypothetical protein